jgi:hypothetical protein
MLSLWKLELQNLSDIKFKNKIKLRNLFCHKFPCFYFLVAIYFFKLKKLPYFCVGIPKGFSPPNIFLMNNQYFSLTNFAPFVTLFFLTNNILLQIPWFYKKIKNKNFIKFSRNFSFLFRHGQRWEQNYFFTFSHSF